jgi:hypothetical protein
LSILIAQATIVSQNTRQHRGHHSRYPHRCRRREA